jgi:hypothetical protein
MKKTASTFFLLPLVALASIAVLTAQPSSPSAEKGVPVPATPKARLSPHDVISKKIDGNRVVIIYGRPYATNPKAGPQKGTVRSTWGGDLVPKGKVWRTGADEATTLTTQKDIVFGDKVVPAGAYTLFTFMEDDGVNAKLIVNKELGQWGVDPYHEDRELVRIPLTRAKLDVTAPVDQFMIAIDEDPRGTGVIKLIWGDAQYSAAYTVKK